MTKSVRVCIEVIFWPEISYGVSLRPMSLRHEIFKTTADGFLKGLSSTAPNTHKKPAHLAFNTSGEILRSINIYVSPQLDLPI